MTTTTIPSMLDVALAYLRAGLSVMPALLVEKRPALPSWKAYRERLPTEAEVRSWFGPDTPLCVVTGAVSGHLEMIDFDLRGELFDRWTALVEESAPGLVARLYVELSQRGGRHVAYRCEAPVCGNLKLAQRPGPPGGGDRVITLIETRGEGGLFLCAPTAGYAATQGNLCSLPVLTTDERDVLLGCAWALDETPRTPCRAVEEGVVSVSSGSDGTGAVRPGDDFNARGDVREVLRAHGWRQVRAGKNEHWCRPGKEHGTSATLRDGVFYVFSSNAPPFEPQKGYSPFAVYALLEHDGDFAAASAALRKQGYGSEPDDAGDVDLSAFESGCTHDDSASEAEHEEEHRVARPADPGPFPDHLLSVPGFIERVVEHNLATAMRPQPALALAAAICLQAVLAARKVRDERGNRTNVYCVGVAPSGAGKDHARKVNKNILFGADVMELEGNEDLASDAGLVTAVEQQPALLFQLDEFGRFLRTIGDPKKAPHLFNMLTALMKLYSSADTVFRGKAYADKRRNKVVDQPCVSVYGTTVPEHFYESLTADSLNDGFIARLLVFEGAATPARRRCRVETVPEPILTTARWWGDFRPGGNLRNEHPEPAVVPTTPEANMVFDAFADLIDRELAGDTGGRSLWARAEEKACRLALIYACSKNHAGPVIDGDAARWACDLSGYLTRRMLYIAHEWVAEGQFDARQKRVLRIIRAAGGSIGRRELSRRTQWLTQRERQEVVANLVETGQLDVRVEKTSNRPRVVYALS